MKFQNLVNKIINKSNFFLICIFLIGLFSIFPYGAHLDQKAEQEILYSNVKMYLRHLGAAGISFDNELAANGIVDIVDSVEKDHGMAVYYPMCGIFYLNQNSPFIGNILWHVYIYLLTFCGVVALFYLVQEMFGKLEVSMLATALFFFTPRMFAESHYNNKDMILLSLVLCIFYFGWKILREKSWKWVIAFSLAGSLATNMKVIGVFIWGMIGLYVLIALIGTHQFEKKIFVKMIVCIILAISFYVIITPACWPDFMGFFKYLFESAQNFRWNSYVLFAGNMYNKNTTGIPRNYLLTMILLSVPVGILLLAAIGGIAVILHLIRKPKIFFDSTGYIFVTMLADLIPLGYAIVAETPVYNGWRHFYFCYASIIMMAVQGISILVNRAEVCKRESIVFGTLGVYVLMLVGGIIVNYPYEYTYYNFLAGKNIENVYELDYWDMSFKQAYELVMKQTEDEKIEIGTISIQAYWGLEAQLYYAIRGKHKMRVVLCNDWREAQYLIVNPTYAYMYAQEEYDTIKQNYILVDSIKAYGNTICEIYQK